MEDRPKIVPDGNVEFTPTDAQPDPYIPPVPALQPGPQTRANGPFPLEKILTESAETYTLSMLNDKLAVRDYELQGVHYFNVTTELKKGGKALKEFAMMVPPDAEVVVDFRDSSSISNHNLTEYIFSMHGTALIRKPNA